MSCISVLVVEDSIYSADLNIREIKKAGFTVQYRMVSSGQSMKIALKEQPWDLIISDNSMPGFSALKALETRNDEAGNTPFLIVSEEISRRDIDLAFQEGCAAYIPKEKLTELRKIVIEVLKTAELPRSVPGKEE